MPRWPTSSPATTTRSAVSRCMSTGSWSTTDACSMPSGPIRIKHWNRSTSQMSPRTPTGGRRPRAGLTAAERKPPLEEMSGLHRFVREAAAGLSPADWSQKTPVIYGEGQDPYPTSPDDVVGWLRDHYREHVQQCPELIASWREMS